LVFCENASTSDFRKAKRLHDRNELRPTPTEIHRRRYFHHPSKSRQAPKSKFHSIAKGFNMFRSFIFVTITWAVIASPAQSQTKTAASWLENFSNQTDASVWVEMTNPLGIGYWTSEIKPDKDGKPTSYHGRTPTSGVNHISTDKDFKNVVYAVTDDNKQPGTHATLLLAKYKNNKKDSIVQCYHLHYAYDSDYGYSLTYYSDKTMKITAIGGADSINLIHPDAYGDSTYKCQEIFDAVPPLKQ